MKKKKLKNIIKQAIKEERAERLKIKMDVQMEIAERQLGKIR